MSSIAVKETNMGQVVDTKHAAFRKTRKILFFVGHGVEDIDKKSDTWAEFDAFVSAMEEKPQFEDFPRCKINITPINFDEV